MSILEYVEDKTEICGDEDGKGKDLDNSEDSRGNNSPSPTFRNAKVAYGMMRM